MAAGGLDALIGKAYPAALDTLGERPTRDSVLAAIRAGHEAAQEVIDGIAADVAASGRRIGCKSGCAFCCHQHIAASPAELLSVFDAVSSWAPERLADLRRRLDQDAPRIAALGHGERRAARIPCAMLDRKTGLCSAYTARPVPCRSHLSLLRTACEREFRNRFATRPGDKPVPVLQEPKPAAGAILVAVELALNRRGLSVEPTELSLGLNAALADPTLFDRWLAGESPFPLLSPPPESRRARLGLTYTAMIRAERDRLAGQGVI